MNKNNNKNKNKETGKEGAGEPKPKYEANNKKALKLHYEDGYSDNLYSWFKKNV